MYVKGPALDHNDDFNEHRKWQEKTYARLAPSAAIALPSFSHVNVGLGFP